MSEVIKSIPDIAIIILSVFAGVGIVGAIVFIFILSMYALRRGGKVKIGNSEIDTEKMQTKFILSAGTLVVDGDFLSWPDTPLAIDDWNQPIYICSKKKW